MEKFKINIKKTFLCAIGAVLVAGLLVSVGFNVYFGVCFMESESYLQSTEQIYIMEAGILRNNLEFKAGTDFELRYDFSHKNYEVLKSRYNIANVAKDGTEFERARRLMDEFASRLTHKSDYDNHVPVNALDLLEYSLDNKNQGINCRAKAQILNEMCLSLGIYARKVWIMPYSGYDGDCHVVNEVWDGSLGKWVMLDVTNNEYWVDENNAPLSVLEIRRKAALREFCTPVEVGDKTDDLQGLKEKHIGDFLYIVKNLTYLQYCTDYTSGESDNTYLLIPENMPSDYELLISEAAVSCPPVK